MEKYIDAEKLKSLIRERYNTCKIGQHSPFRNGKVETLRETIELIDSLHREQPKVDLEKEIETFTTRLYNNTFGNDQGTLDEFDWEDIATVIEETAHHFCEFGLRKAAEMYD